MADSTYTPANSNNYITHPVDWIRRVIGDTDSGAFILLDAEITAETSESSNKYLVASECAYQCATRLGEYDKLAILFRTRGDQLKLKAKNSQFTTSSTVSQVRDVETYPDRFVHGDEKLPAWDIEPNDGDYV